MSARPAESYGFSEDAGWNRVLEHRSRLGACVLLSRVDALSFRRLKDLLQETDGNLGAHLKRLEDEGLVRARKTFERRKPVTWYSLTKRGRRSLQAHLEALDRVIANGRESST